MTIIDIDGVVRGLDPRIQQRGIAAQKTLLRADPRALDTRIKSAYDSYYFG